MKSLISIRFLVTCTATKHALQPAEVSPRPLKYAGCDKRVVGSDHDNNLYYLNKDQDSTSFESLELVVQS